MNRELKTCRIREWTQGDESSLARHANDRQVWINLRNLFPHPYTVAEAKKWIRHAGARHRDCLFAIEVDGQAVGGIGFHPGRDVHRRSAEIGFWLGKAYWGRGIMTEAVRAVTDYAFATFDLCRIHAAVFEWNPASMRVLEKAGYSCEGRLRKSVTKDGKTIDQLLYAIVRE